MESIKRKAKRITSIILIITILVGVLPNFGLLKVTEAASEDESVMIVRPGVEEFEEINGNKIFKVNICLQNVSTNSWSIYMQYDSDKFVPADKITGEETTNIDKCIEISNPTQFGIDSNNNKYAENGEIYFIANTGSSTSHSLDYISFIDEQEVCTIFFKVKNHSLTISQVSADDFIINKNKEDSDFTSIALSEEDANLSSAGDGIIYADLDTKYFTTKEFKGAAVQSISVKTNPTEGKEYIHGDEIDLTGGELTLTYSDNSTEDISMLDENVKITTNEQEGAVADYNNPVITFDYKGKRLDLNVAVIDVIEKIEFYDKNNYLPNTEFTHGDNINKDELYIKATTKTGTTKEINLLDSRISLDSEKADMYKITSPYYDEGQGYCGLQPIQITYKDEYVTKTTSFNLVVNDKVGSIKISESNPPEENHKVGDIFAKTGAIEVIGLYTKHNYGEVNMSSSDVIVTEMNGAEVDLSKPATDKALKVTFGGAETSYKINVSNFVKSIKVNKTTKTKYNEEIKASDFDGATVTEIMADGSEGETKPLDFAWVDTSTYNNKITSIQNLKVNYPSEGIIVEGIAPVQVKDKLLGIRVENLKNEYIYKDKLNYEGAEFYLEYASGEYGPSNLSDFDFEDIDSELKVSGFDNTIIGDQEVTFTYNDGIDEASTKVTVNVGKATLEAPKCEQLEIVEGKALSTIADELPTTEYGNVLWKDGAQTLTYVEGAENIHKIDATYKMNTTNAPYYNDVDLQVEVKVLKRDVSKIEITTPPTDTDYVEGQDFDPTGMVITVTYNDGDTTLINSDYTTKGVTFAPSASLQTTDTEILVTYSGKTATQDITVVEKKVTSIAVTTPPTKTSYVEGQTLNLDGMVVTATYNDGDIQPTTEYTTNPANGATLNTLGLQEIEVTYTGTDAVAGIATASTNVTVEEKKVTSIAVTTPPTKTSYVEGQALNLDGMIVTATYNDGDVQPTTDYTTSPANGATLNTVGLQTIEVTYTGTDAVAEIAKASTSVEVEKKVVTSIAVATPPTKTSYVEGQNLDTTGMVVTATYNDGTSAVTTDYTTNPANGEALTPANTTVTITYGGTDIADGATAPTANVAITVNERQVESIAITKAPTKVNYIEGQDFEPEGMEITVNYNDHVNPMVISSDYAAKGVTFAPATGLQTTDNKIVVSYRGFTDNQAITVIPDSVTDITITAPNKLEYKYGDAIDLTGATITKIWASGLTHANDTIPMTKDMLSNTDITNFNNMNSLGQKQITVTYEAVVKPNAFQIEIKDYINAIEIEDETRLQEEYEYGDTINVTDKDTGADLYILAKYAGGTPDKKVKLTTDMVSGFNMSKVQNNQTVTVTYAEKTDTFTINVKDKVTGIEITKEPEKKVYKLNEAVNFNDIVIKNVMASGDAGTVLTISDYEISTVDTTTVGEKTVTVTKKGTSFTDTFKIKVIDTTEAMNITKMPKRSYKYGDALNITDGEITITTQSDSIVIPMTDASVKVTGYNANKLGDQTLTVTYTYSEETDNGMETKQKTDTYTVNVEDYATGIAITKEPNKLTYEYGESLELAGGKVAEKMASGVTKNEVDITGEMVSGYEKTKEGSQVITVTYLGKTDAFTVTVKDLTKGISMKTLPTKTEYTQGESLDVSGAVLNVTKSSGIKEIPVTKEMISGYDSNKVGVQIITVTYNGFTTEFVVDVKAKEQKPTNPEKPTKPTNPSKPSKPTKPSDNVQTPEIQDKYTVTFIGFDGTILKTETVEKGQSATAPEIPQREGYKFLGWDREFDVVEEDITVMGRYEEIKRSEVNIPKNKDIEIEEGKDLDLSDITITIYDEVGEKIDEIPVTMDMVSGYNPNKVGVQTITITYVDENGVEYKSNLKVKVVKPAKVLGVKDETSTENDNIKDTLIPAMAGVGVTGLLLILIGIITKKNVEIYAVTEEERKLIGREKISKSNKMINLDEYKEKLEEAETIELVINKKTVEKLEDERIKLQLNSKTKEYKINEVIRINK